MPKKKTINLAQYIISEEVSLFMVD
ncbi:hypothetical protein EMIT0194P_200055 [Pseudomonas serbica]